MTRAPAHRAAPGSGSRHLALLFVGLMLSMLLAALNQTVLSTALPTIVGELNGVDEMLWVITAYILASTIMMPVYGKLGDLMGRKPLLLGAILVFMAGSVVGALAGTIEVLIAARAIQGLGGGGLIILSQAAIADVVPARERGRYMGVMGGVFAVSSVAGPLLGGFFTEGPGWRWVFWINIPLGLLALAGAVLFLKLPRHSGRPRLDIGGMVLLAVATTCLVLFATWGGGKYAWTDPVLLGLIAGTLVTAAAFVAVERRTAEPIIPMHLFRERNFVLTTLAGLLTGVAMFGALGYLPTYLQMVFGVDATRSGLLMVPMMGTMLVTSVLAGQAVSRTGRYKWLPVAGSVIVAAAMGLLATLTSEQGVWHVCLYIAVLGLGLGLSMQVLVLIVQNTFPLRQVGTATAANNFFRQIGATLGSGVVGSVFASRLAELMAERVPAAALEGGAGGANSLTPAVVASLPQALQDPIVTSYNDALTPIYLWIMPLGLLAAAVLCFVAEKPLATTIEQDVEPEALAEGRLMVTADEPAAPRAADGERDADDDDDARNARGALAGARSAP
ncbi:MULTISPECIES: MDR family MFS transporter [Kocuria]|uniref:MDR family MFS transporter n=1 Tax=Kocuria TaxID=57493 RepID=UPI0009DF7EAC|nr:MDR family MFS transporter [Kocuria polaris]